MKRIFVKIVHSLRSLKLILFATPLAIEKIKDTFAKSLASKPSPTDFYVKNNLSSIGF